MSKRKSAPIEASHMGDTTTMPTDSGDSSNIQLMKSNIEDPRSYSEANSETAADTC